MNHDKSLSSGDLVHLPGALTMSRLRGCGDVCVIAGPRCFSFVEEDVRTVTVNGQPAWQMSVSSGGTAYVAARGTPYPLRMVQGPDRIDFTRWNSVVIPPLPPASQVVDLSQLENL